MITTKTIRLNKIVNLKDYLQKKAMKNRLYDAYVEQSIKKAEDDFRNGRVYTLDELKKCIEEELGLTYE